MHSKFRANLEEDLVNKILFVRENKLSKNQESVLDIEEFLPEPFDIHDE